MTTPAIQTIPRIYVACLAAYNNGRLHGAWIDATHEPDAIYEAVQAMLKASPQPDAEEWAIHDYEGFAGITISEWEGFAQVHALALFAGEHGSLGAEVLSYYGGDLEEAREALNERYAGLYRSAADYAEQLTIETTEVPASLALYIDYEAMARDLELNGDILTFQTGFEETHVFWSR